MIEIWKDVVGYEGYYQVSNLGGVRSLDRVVTHARLGPQKLKGKMLKACESKRGYWMVNLCRDGSPKAYTVHRLVMRAFVGPSALEVCHNDGNRLNNHIDNLRYDTRQGNCADTLKHGRTICGSKSHHALLEEQDIVIIRRLCNETGLTDEKIGEIFSVKRKVINDIKLNRTWKHVS